VYRFDARNIYSNVLSLNINTPATYHILSMGTPNPPVSYPGITPWAGVVREGTRVPYKLPDLVPCYLVTAALLIMH